MSSHSLVDASTFFAKLTHANRNNLPRPLTRKQFQDLVQTPIENIAFWIGAVNHLLIYLDLAKKDNVAFSVLLSFAEGRKQFKACISDIAHTAGIEEGSYRRRWRYFRDQQELTGFRLVFYIPGKQVKSGRGTVVASEPASFDLGPLMEILEAMRQFLIDDEEGHLNSHHAVRVAIERSCHLCLGVAQKPVKYKRPDKPETSLKKMLTHSKKMNHADLCDESRDAALKTYFDGLEALLASAKTPEQKLALIAGTRKYLERLMEYKNEDMNKEVQ